MLDMHTDMQGSAVALGTLLALAELRVPFGIDAWLAITENRLGRRRVQVAGSRDAPSTARRSR